MSKQTSPPTPTRVRIYSHITQSRFLHVEDALQIGKLRVFAGTYKHGKGMSPKGHCHHFLDLADARVIFQALMNGEQNYSYRENKGTPPQKGKNTNGKSAISRVLSIQVRGEKVYIELKHGPGKVTATGAITPAGKATVAVNVGFKRHEAQRMAATVLAYIHAWDVLRMMSHQEVVSQPPPYLVVPAGRRSRGAEEPGSRGEKRLTSGHRMPASARQTNSRQQRKMPAGYNNVKPPTPPPAKRDEVSRVAKRGE